MGWGAVMWSPTKSVVAMKQGIGREGIARGIGETPKGCTSLWNRGSPLCASSTFWKLDIPKWKLFRTEHT